MSLSAEEQPLTDKTSDRPPPPSFKQHQSKKAAQKYNAVKLIDSDEDGSDSQPIPVPSAPAAPPSYHQHIQSKHKKGETQYSAIPKQDNDGKDPDSSASDIPIATLTSKDTKISPLEIEPVQTTKNSGETTDKNATCDDCCTCDCDVTQLVDKYSEMEKQEKLICWGVL
eukprot:237585_1